MLRRILAVLAVLAAVPSGAGVVCSSTNSSCQTTTGSGGSGGGASDTLFVATADASVDNTAAETSIIGTGVGSLTTSAGYLSAGSVLSMTASGYLATPVAADTLTIKVKAGSTVVGSVTLTPANSLSDAVFQMHFDIVCRTAGATGTVIMNTPLIAMNTGSPNDVEGAGIVNTSAVTLDTTGTLAWNITATWGSAQVGQTITGTNFQMYAPGVSLPLSAANGGLGLTAAADDNVPVGNGSAWQSKALADCDDSGGNHLNYDTTSNVWSCGTSSAISSCAAVASIVGEVTGTCGDVVLSIEPAIQGAALEDPVIDSIVGTTDENLSIEAGFPPVDASAVAGLDVTIAGSAAQGGSDPGAAAGGNVTLTGGNAARTTSGNANGGTVTLTGGAGIGTGRQGEVVINSAFVRFVNPATPTTPSSGSVAFYGSLWAASRGTLVVYDGTAQTALVNVLASDTPLNGQCLQWNTGGTITWETCAGGGISGLTTGTIPKAASATTLNDSRLSQTSTDLQAKQGAGSATSRLGGYLFSDVTSTAGTDTSGTQQDFPGGAAAYTLPADTFDVNGAGIRITAVATTAANTNSKGFYISFGGTNIGYWGASNASNDKTLIGTCTVLRTTGTSAQVGWCQIVSNDGPGYPYYASTSPNGTLVSLSVDTTAGVAVKAGYSEAAGSDVTYKAMIIEAIRP